MSSPPSEYSGYSSGSGYFPLDDEEPVDTVPQEAKTVKALESNPLKMKLTQETLLQKEQIYILKDINRSLNDVVIQLRAIKNCNCKKEKKRKPREIPDELKAAMYMGGYKKRKSHRRKSRRRKSRRRKSKRKTRR